MLFSPTSWLSACEYVRIAISKDTKFLTVSMVTFHNDNKCYTAFFSMFLLEIDRYTGHGQYICWYLGFTNISVLAKMADFEIGLIRCWQNAVTFLTYADNLGKKTQQTKSRQLSCINASRCVFINKQTRWTMEHVLSQCSWNKSIIINQIN